MEACGQKIGNLTVCQVLTKTVQSAGDRKILASRREALFFSKIRQEMGEQWLVVDPDVWSRLEKALGQ